MTFWIATVRGDTLRATDLAARHGVRADAGRPSLRLRYDGLGIGRIANSTIRLQRGTAEAGLSISAYGRVRTW